MLNHKTVLEWSIANDNFLQYAIVIGKFYCTTYAFQVIDINRLHFNIKVFKEIETRIHIFVFTFQSLLQS